MLAVGRAPLPVGSAGSESVQCAPVSRGRHAPASASRDRPRVRPGGQVLAHRLLEAALARVADPDLDALRAPRRSGDRRGSFARRLRDRPAPVSCGCCSHAASFPSLRPIRPCPDASPACIRLDADPRAAASAEPASRRREPPSPPNPVFAGPSPGFCGDVVWAAQPRPLRATALRRLSAASPSGSEDVRGIPKGACPLGGGMGRAAPCAIRYPGFSLAFPAEGCAASRSRRKRAGNPWREGCRGPGCPGARGRVPRSRGAAAAGEAEGGGVAGRGPSGLRGGCYAMDSASETSLLIWCLSRALPAVTTIMSMPSKRTGTSPSGV